MLRRSLSRFFLSKFLSPVADWSADAAAASATLAGKAADTRRAAAAAATSAEALPCPRSILFVPCSNAKALKKAASLPCDLLMLDLEDSVPPSKKGDARTELSAVLDSGDLAGKRVVVRINSPTDDPVNGLLDLDRVGMHCKALEGIGLPKVTRSTYDVVKPYLAPGHAIWAFFETPEGFVDIEAICSQQVYAYAVMGYNDLRAALDLPMKPSSPHFAKAPFLYSCSRLILAARAAKMYPIDGVFNDPHDAAGFVDDCVAGKALGFAGKTLIHPSQVGPTNTAYAPTAEEAQWAQRVLEAVKAAGGGVATVDGKMVEEMHARQAARILQRRGDGTPDPKPAEGS